MTTTAPAPLRHRHARSHRPGGQHKGSAPPNAARPPGANATATNTERDADIVPNVVPGVTVPTAFPDDVPIPGGQHRCPHCRRPLAIISVVIPADAAIVRPPEDARPFTTALTSTLQTLWVPETLHTDADQVVRFRGCQSMIR